MIALATPDNRIDALPLGVVVHGDCIEVMQTLSDNSLDACVVDPPYGLGEVKDIAGLLGAWLRDEDDSPYIGKSGFMGKDWDAGVPGPRYWREVYRVLKPGAHILCFAGTRTVDLMTIALRLAGFEIRDQLEWLHGQGFPKSTDISKKLDKMAGAERKVIGINEDYLRRKPNGMKTPGATAYRYSQVQQETNANITAPATSEAQQWNGYGTALKPAHEPIILARKPLAEPSIAANVLRWNCGALNIDACRVGSNGDQPKGSGNRASWRSMEGRTDVPHSDGNVTPNGKRWPANLLLSHSIWCIPQGTKRVRNTSGQANGKERAASGSMLDGMARNGTVYYGEFEEVEAWQCAEDCPIRLLDEQSGVRKSVRSFRGEHADMRGNNYNRSNGARLAGTNTERGYDDIGGSSRYFTNLPPDVPFLYTSKASRAERNAGCEGLPLGEAGAYGEFAGDGRGRQTEHTPAANGHPTVKPLSLMRWLIRLITPPDGIVLDCFAGSGSTCVAAIHEGVHFIGIEQDESYTRIAEARIAHARREVSV